MHWLPLVAMVIASALPFPHIPVARNVAATTDPGRHLGGRTADADASRGAPSQEDDNTTPAYTGALRLNMGPDKDPLDPSALHPDTSFHSNGEAEKGQLRTSVSASRKDYVSQDKGESEDYRSAGRVEGVEPGLWAGMEGLQGDELFLDAHPRVLFSPSASPPGHPPLLLLESGMPAGEEEQEEQEEEQEEVSDADRHIEGHGDREPDRGWAESPPGAGEGRRPAVRNKRSHLTPAKMGEKAVCDMESKWVMDKKMAIDMHGRNVTIVPEIQTLTGPLKQYFYETRCRQEPPAPGVAPRGPGAAGRGPGAAGRGPGAAGRSPEAQGVAGGTCRGVDKKQWSSQCKARQSYVRALTRDSNNRTGWRWIRIDSSCVCVLLSQANRRGRVEGWRGPT